VRRTDSICSSFLAFAEFHAVLHRHLREGSLSPETAREIASRFSRHVEQRLWNLIPVSEGLLRRTGTLMLSARNEVFLRSADAIHLTTASDARETEVWTNDRHMLAAAPHFGLKGRSVQGG